MQRLFNLDFSDIYVPLNAPEQCARYNPSPAAGRAGNFPVPTEYAADVSTLATQIVTHIGTEFSMTYPAGSEPNAPGSMRLRVAKQILLDGKQWACCRRFYDQVRSLDSLGFYPHDLAALEDLYRYSGLVVISGGTGVGKTTSAVAMLKHYLEKRGGVAVTIEDPIEYILQGEVGKQGYCYQVPVEHDQEWAQAIKLALRWKPKFIFCGEIRTAAAAAQLITAACSGHLVICTIHGGSITEAIQRLTQIASGEMGDTARLLLADCLVTLAHQRLEKGRPILDVLSATGTGEEAVRSTIRDAKVEQLGSIIGRQDALRRQSVAKGRDEKSEEPPRPSPSSNARPAPLSGTTTPAATKKKSGILGLFGK